MHTKKTESEKDWKKSLNMSNEESASMLKRRKKNVKRKFLEKKNIVSTNKSMKSYVLYYHIFENCDDDKRNDRCEERM